MTDVVPVVTRGGHHQIVVVTLASVSKQRRGKLIKLFRILFRINPPKGGRLFETFCYFPGKKSVYILFELLDEDIVEGALSFNLIDEENDDEELEIL